MRSTIIYEDALEHARGSQIVSDAFGGGIRPTGITFGYLHSRDNSGGGFLVTPILGVRGVGMLHAVVRRERGVWRYSSLEVTAPGHLQPIDLLVAPRYKTSDLDRTGRLYLLAFGPTANASLKDLAKYCQDKLGVTATILPPLPLDESVIDVHRNQAVTEEMMQAVKRNRAQTADPYAMFIAVTDSDMYAQDWPYAFNYWYDNVAVISTARLDPRFYGWTSAPALADSRLHKLVARDVGLLYFKLPESADPTSVLYYNYSGVDDVDVMRESFRGLENRGLATIYPTTGPVPPLQPVVRKEVSEVAPTAAGYPCLLIERAFPAGAKLRGRQATCLPHLMDDRPLEDYEVDLHSGWFVYRQTDIFLPDTMPLALTRNYSCWDRASRSFGLGTAHPYDVSIFGRRNPFSFLRLWLANGSTVDYPRISEGSGYRDALYEHTSRTGFFYGSRIQWDGDGWSMKFMDGTTARFPEAYWSNSYQQGALVDLRDSRGEEIHFQRDPSRRLTSIASPHGRRIRFTYDEGNRIISAVDDAGHTFEYSYDDGGRLREVRQSGKVVRRYSYEYERMIAVQDGDGRTLLANEYFGNGRIKQVKLPDGSVWRLNYSYDKKYNVTATDLADPAGRHTYIKNPYPGKNEQ